MVIVQYDPEVGATYVSLIADSSTAAATVEVSDLVSVDLDRNHEPIGVDFAVPPHMITGTMIEKVIETFPTLKSTIGNPHTWLPMPSPSF